MQRIPFTTHDVQLVRTYYPREGARGVVARMRTPKTLNAVRLLAHRLRVRGPVKRPHLVAMHTKLTEELRNLVRYDMARACPGMTVAQVAAALGVSRRTIYHLMEQGAHCPEHEAKGAWSAAEIAILREYYPRGGWRAVNAHLPAFRSDWAIHAAARRNGVTARGRHIAAEQVAECRALVADGVSDGKIAARLGIGESTVSRIRRGLGRYAA